MIDMSKKELMDKATELGLEPHPNTGSAKLLRMIQEATSEDIQKPDVSKKSSGKLKDKESRIERHARLRKEQRKLIRVIVRCNDESKKEWNSVNIKVCNTLHTFTRNIPFNNENGWHIEQATYNMLKEKKCTRFKDVTLPNGMKHREPYLINAYTIETLRPLTKKELKDLANEQKARGSIG